MEAVILMRKVIKHISNSSKTILIRKTHLILVFFLNHYLFRTLCLSLCTDVVPENRLCITKCNTGCLIASLHDIDGFLIF